MADGLYIGMAAATARSEQLDSIADNLANTETPGFKAVRPAFQSFLPSPGMTDKVFTGAVATGVDMSPGNVVTTDNPLDLVPANNAFIGVTTGKGQVAFTRNGQLTLDGNNVLVAQGLPVVGVDGQPIIVPPQTSATVQEDGSVVAAGTVVGQIGLFDLQGNVQKLGASLFVSGPGGNATPTVNGRVAIGQLEMGNATPLEATVQMISAQRHFETAMQAIQTYRQLDEKTIQVGLVR